MRTRTLKLAVAVALVGGVLIAQNVNQAGRYWVYHQGDQGGTRFSTLTQIDVSNGTNLERAWTFHTGSGRFASSPMVVDSVMYFSAPNGIYAVDAVTGTQLWKYVPPPDPTAAAAAPAAPAGADPATAGRGAAGRGAVAGDPAGAPPARGGGGRGGG